MKILFMNAYFKPESVAYTPLEQGIMDALLAAGHEIMVLCPVPTRGIDASVAKEYSKKKHEQLENGRITVRRFWAPQEGGNPLLRAIRYVWCNLREYMLACKQREVQCVFAASTPPTQGMLCALVKKRLKIPFVYNLQDVFPDSLVNANMTQKGSAIWKVGRKVEDFSYRHADKIIVISESFKQNIIEKGVPEEKVVVVPNWVDTDDVYSVTRQDNILFERFGLDRSKFYVCYSGNIGHSQNLELLIEAAKRLQTELPDIQFVLVGEGAAKSELMAAVEEQKLENMKVFPFQPYEDIAHVFSLGDAGLIISKPGIGGSSVPSKTWSIMAAERPVLASFDKDSELFRMVDAMKCGLCADANSVDALIESIKKLYSDREAAKEMGARGRAYIKENLDREKCTGVYVKSMTNVVQAGE